MGLGKMTYNTYSNDFFLEKMSWIHQVDAYC